MNKGKITSENPAYVEITRVDTVKKKMNTRIKSVQGSFNAALYCTYESQVEQALFSQTRMQMRSYSDTTLTLTLRIHNFHGRTY